MSLYFPSTEDQSRHTIFPGVTIRTAAAERMMLSLVDLCRGRSLKSTPTLTSRSAWWSAAGRSS